MREVEPIHSPSHLDVVRRLIYHLFVDAGEIARLAIAFAIRTVVNTAKYGSVFCARVASAWILHPSMPFDTSCASAMEFTWRSAIRIELRVLSFRVPHEQVRKAEALNLQYSKLVRKEPHRVVRRRDHAFVLLWKLSTKTARAIGFVAHGFVYVALDS